MKGMGFSEFCEMVDSAFGGAILGNIIEDCNLPAGSVYARAGSYEYNQLLALAGQLSKLTKAPIEASIRFFLSNLISLLSNRYKTFLTLNENLLEQISPAMTTPRSTLS